MTEIRYTKRNHKGNDIEDQDDLFYWIWERLDQGMIEEKITQLSKLVAILLTKAIEKDNAILYDVVEELKKSWEKDFTIVKEEKPEGLVQ